MGGGHSDQNPDADFEYDYSLIRRGGLIFAGVAFVLGIAIVFSHKLSCGNKKRLQAQRAAENNAI
ncbi:sodium/potassium-transporting ATPase subunit gamma [Engraulis encrasicolus]|uniref:sodium/potassium-transporting ATPase subunit gamma n=1 Tax=Engraulis encrasicolus TaxID=184585 RepID=UPI002FD15601